MFNLTIELILMVCILSTHSMEIPGGHMEWIVDKTVAAYGQTLKLHCKVADCCVEYSGWVLWDYDSRDFRTTAIDVRDFRNKKFSGKLKKDGFTLVIRNLAETDLNRNYSCTYGGKVGEMKLLLEEEAFNREYREADHSEEDRAGLSVGAIVAVVATACIIFIVGISIGVVLLKRWDRHTITGYLSGSHLNYSEVVFEAGPSSISNIIHGSNDKTIYSEIDLASSARFHHGCSDTSSDEDIIYIDGIVNFQRKNEIK